jgi:hypothetical protein
MGLSVFSTSAAAGAMALKWPMIGTFIAELNLESEHGFFLDSVQLFFPAACRDQDRLYHGTQVNNQVPPL